ncbi:helix-turn-helix domain-containing protein [Paraflavitalea sp. CAU 1676]|uniref:winged helix-turn-helix transcriptional regulator n=1 Tax=Paraflavitalea sp. CAU 1676 TaxID=3032598 RepID=UPI0023DAAE5C|nr:helix-turn-helix domain-containing protein [Paraflavitalea sp. CAU 1676]MDF2190418.1 helix-turn-helix domain-containing protein [Paraflavitalea sp. CAU 1676]
MRSDCPLNYGLEIFGDKWTLLIIRDLMFFGKRYYSEFLESAEGISTNILADRLNTLEQQKIITKKKSKLHKQKVIYSLTQKGIDLLPVIVAIGLWSDEYADNLNPHRDIVIGEAKRNYTQGIKSVKLRLQKMHLE